MNLSTPITSAARRICRDLNTAPVEATRYYDADGNYVAGHESGMWFADPSDRPVAAVSSRGHRNNTDGRMTERAAQDLLDAAVATGGYDGPGHDDWLNNLAGEREYAAGRND